MIFTSTRPWQRLAAAVLVLCGLAGLLLSAVPSDALVKTSKEPLTLGYYPNIPDSAGGSACNLKTLKGCGHAQVVIRAINATPCNGRITASFYSMSLDAYADALVAKQKCGTELHILTWHDVTEDGKAIPASPQLLKIRNAIAKYKHGWYKDCRNSCYDTSTEGTQHLKEWLFSSTGGLSNVIIHDENNPTRNGDFLHFGSMTVMSDACAYPKLSAWMDLGQFDTNQKAPKPFSTCDGQRTFHLAPSKDNVTVSMLKAIKKPAKDCYVAYDVAQTSLSAPTDQLIRLKKAGCKVRAVVDWKIVSPDTDGPYQDALVGPNKYQVKQIRRLVAAGIPAYDASWSELAYNHRKQTIAQNNGKRWFISGATNQTSGSFRAANLLLVSHVDADVTAAYKASDVMAAYSHKLTKTTVGCVGKKSKQPTGCK